MPCYDQSCTASDLVNIPSLVLSDTFNTWFDRTNQLIRVANAINVFDVGVGPTDGGLRLDRGCSGNYYSGVAVFYVEQGAGIGVGTQAFTNNYNKVVIDATRLQDLGGSTATNPEVDDYFIVSDKSDTRQSAFGTPKRVVASRMLPNTVYFGPTGSGTFTIQGNLSVIGNVTVQGTESYVDSNDLRIEDKVIELAYGRYAEVTVLGSGLTAGTFTSGMTAFYADSPTIPDESNATTVGRVFDWQIAVTGESGIIRISSFSSGGVNDFQLNGNLVVTGGSYPEVLSVTGPLGIGDYFLNDDQLQPAGIVVKGAQGDKTFLWVCNAPQGSENWNAFVSNKNLGVSGPGNWILSSKFASYGYSDSTVDNTFTYLGAGDSFTKYSVGNELVMEHSPTGNPFVGATFGIVHMGSTGPNVLPGVPVYDWVKYFNADQLDGAHASTASVPWTIPIMGADGRVDGNMVNADAIRKKFTVPGHAFSKGDVVRYNDNGSLTFASASTVPEAEALGIIETISGNEIVVVTKGFIYGLTSGTRLNAILPLVTGNVYFLSPVTPGGMIDSPETGIGIDPGEVRKAMLLAAGSNSGYVVNYTGVVVGDEPTDTVYMSTFAPVGSIQPYAGSIADLPRNWLPCDGRRLRRNDYPDLYILIGQSYYANATRTAPSNELSIDDDTRDLQLGDNVTVTWGIPGGGTVQGLATVSSINDSSRTLLLSFSSNGELFNSLPVDTALKVYGRVAGTGTSVFFLPDLRRRTPFGVSQGAFVPGSGTTVPSLSIGQIGGKHQITLNSPVPTNGSGAFGNLSSTIDSLPPYIALNWIIRVRKGADATILTGHNHDLRYIRYDGPHTVDGGAANDLNAIHRAQFRSNARVLSNGIDGPDTFYDSLDIYGQATISGGANIFGSVDGGSYSLVVNGSARCAGNLDVNGNTRLMQNVEIGKSASPDNWKLTVYGGITASRSLDLLGNLTVGGIVSGSLTGGNARIFGSLTAGRIGTVAEMRVGTDLTINDDLFVNDDASISGDASVLGKLYVNRPLGGGFGSSTIDPNTRFEVLGLARSTATVAQINADQPGGQALSNDNVLPNRKYVETVLRNAVSHIRFNANGTVVSKSGLMLGVTKTGVGTYRVNVFYDSPPGFDGPGQPSSGPGYSISGVVVTAMEQGNTGAPYHWVESMGQTGFTVKSAYFSGSSRVMEDRAMTVSVMNPHGIGKGDLSNCPSSLFDPPCL